MDEGWEQVNDDDLEEFMYNKDAGIEIRHQDGRIVAMHFHYLSRDYDSYRGKTEKGVDAKCGIVDVRSKHGDPSYIDESKQSEFGEFPGAEEIRIDYAEEGIMFTFVDEKLAHITVTSPRKEVDYDYIERLFGDSLIYIRPREKRRSVTAPP